MNRTKDILLAVTSYNQVEFTRRCFETLKDFRGKIICMDDASSDPVEDLCKEFGVDFYGRSEAKGLTHSWNQAYRIFLESRFRYLVISNNDVLFPSRSLANLADDLSVYPYVGVMTRKKEPWKHAKIQGVENYHDLASIDPNEPGNYEKIQQLVLQNHLKPVAVDVVYGFCFGVSKEIEKCTFSKDCLLTHLTST